MVDTRDCLQGGEPTATVQEATGQAVEVAFVDRGYAGDEPAAATCGIRLDVVKLPRAKRGFVLLPRRRVAEHSLAPDDERRHTALAGFRFVAFALLALQVALPLLQLLGMWITGSGLG